MTWCLIKQDVFMTWCLIRQDRGLRDVALN